jgi:hypothetical protein
MQGFLLGLANGTSCLALCAPILIPFLLSEGNNVGQNLATLLKFLGGRLGGYLLFALLAWAVGGLLTEAGGYQGLMIGGTYMGLSALLLVAVFRKKKSAHGACGVPKAQVRLRSWPTLIPLGMGLLAGLKVCPPLLLAFADAASTGGLDDVTGDGQARAYARQCTNLEPGCSTGPPQLAQMDHLMYYLPVNAERPLRCAQGRLYD